MKYIRTPIINILSAISAGKNSQKPAIIRGVLEDAVLDGLISMNVADRVKLPRVQKFEGSVLTEEQVGVLLSMAGREPEPIRAAIVLAVCYGLRRSEVCGLR